MAFYPWHETIRQRITQLFANDKLAHALLFSGPEHIGKLGLATELSKLFLCTNAESVACGQCGSCHLIAAGTHPDFRIMSPEESKLIKIDQVRSLISWVNQTAQRSGPKIVIINPAQQMNHQSANALLKCLEEPSANTLIILVTPRPGSLLPTIRSRCQRYVFPIPDREIALSWLEQEIQISDAGMCLDIVGGAPLAVIGRFDTKYREQRRGTIDTLLQILVNHADPLKSAALLLSQEMEEVFALFLSVLSDCVKQKLSAGSNTLKNQDSLVEIAQMAGVCSTEFIFSALDRVAGDLNTLRGTTNPNKALLLENLLIDFADQQSHPIPEFGL